MMYDTIEGKRVEIINHKGLLKSEICEKHTWMDLYSFRLMWITDSSIHYTILTSKPVRENSSEQLLRLNRGGADRAAAVISLTSSLLTILMALPIYTCRQEKLNMLNSYSNPQTPISKTTIGINWLLLAWCACEWYKFRTASNRTYLCHHKTGLGLQCRRFLLILLEIFHTFTSYKLPRNGKIRLKWITMRFENGSLYLCFSKRNTLCMDD